MTKKSDDYEEGFKDAIDLFISEIPKIYDANEEVFNDKLQTIRMSFYYYLEEDNEKSIDS